MVAVQSALADRPGVLTTARGLSHFGEHSIGWVAVSLLGAVLAPRRRRDWLVAGAGAFVAHAAAVLIKRLVRRKRPHHPAVAVNVGTPSQLSFPSAHATSTTAAAILMGRATGLPLPAVLVPPMALSRILLGVHYPSDVAFGVALGAAVARLALWLDGRGVSRMSEDVVTGPPANLITGVVKAMRPRQWVKNVLVLAAPLAAVGRGRPLRLRPGGDPGVGGLRGVQPGGLVDLPDQRRARRRGRPRAPHQAVPPDRGRRGARVAGLHSGRGAGGGLAGHCLVADAEPGAGDGGLHRHAAGLLLRPQAPSGDGHLHRVVGVFAPGHRRRRGHRYPDCRSGFC